MKVYTTTYYKKNYGSALQAVALQKKLMELGYESVIIKPRPVEKINVSLIERIKFFLDQKDTMVLYVKLEDGCKEECCKANIKK